jgi:hypothetical protein
MTKRWSWLEKLLARPIGIVLLCTLGVMFLAAIEGLGVLFEPEKAGAFVIFSHTPNPAFERTRRERSSVQIRAAWRAAQRER